MYFAIFQGEDPRYAVMHLVQTFCDVFYVCRNKIFKIEIEIANEDDILCSQYEPTKSTS